MIDLKKAVLCGWILCLGAGCASGDNTGGTGTGGGTGTSTTPSPDKGAPDKGSPDKNAAKAAGPSCTAYYKSGGCCEELSSGIQAAKDACAQAKKAIDDGITAGGQSSTYEAACKQAIDTAKQLGKCG